MIGRAACHGVLPFCLDRMAVGALALTTTLVGASMMLDGVRPHRADCGFTLMVACRQQAAILAKRRCGRRIGLAYPSAPLETGSWSMPSRRALPAARGQRPLQRHDGLVVLGCKARKPSHWSASMGLGRGALTASSLTASSTAGSSPIAAEAHAPEATGE